MKAMLIINPVSGTVSKTGLEGAVRSRLENAGVEVVTQFTTCHGDATCFARQAIDQQFELVIAAGGDGTVNETAAALCDTDVVLGILPFGSGNGLARHLDIPGDLNRAMRIIEAGHVVKIDSAEVNGRKFFCTFGVGFDAAVSETFARQRRRGKMTYIRSALSTYVKYHPELYTITANGQLLTERAFLVAVCNASQYGNNAYIAPEASITDGLLDVTIVHSGPLPSMAHIGIDLMTGYINRNTRIHSFKARNITICRSASGPAHIDGEPVSIGDCMEIECRPRALRILTPGEQPVTPFITPVISFVRDLKLSVNHLFHKL